MPLLGQAVEAWRAAAGADASAAIASRPLIEFRAEVSDACYQCSRKCIKVDATHHSDHRPVARDEGAGHRRLAVTINMIPVPSSRAFLVDGDYHVVGAFG